MADEVRMIRMMQAIRPQAVRTRQQSMPFGHMQPACSCMHLHAAQSPPGPCPCQNANACKQLHKCPNGMQVILPPAHRSPCAQGRPKCFTSATAHHRLPPLPWLPAQAPPGFSPAPPAAAAAPSNGAGPGDDDDVPPGFSAAAASQAADELAASVANVLVTGEAPDEPDLSLRTYEGLQEDPDKVRGTPPLAPPCRESNAHRLALIGWAP